MWGENLEGLNSSSQLLNNPVTSHWELLSMQVRLVERNFGTAPNPIHWCVYRISLDTYSAKFWGSSGVGEAFVLLSLVAKNYEIVFFILPSPSRRKLLLWYSYRYVPCIAHDRPRCHLITFLESHCSVTFILNPLFPRGIISKILHSILQYTNKMQYKSSFFFVFFNFF